jgi:RNA polymerase sigma-54 factor
MLKNSQSLSLHQKLSPNIIQAQLLLALPTLALEQEIKEQLEDNPVLEEDVLDPEASSESEEVPVETAADEPEETYDIEEWYDYQETDTEGYKSPEEYDKQSNMDFETKSDYILNKQERFKESPLDQLHGSGLDEKSIIIGEEILGSLDDEGYLRDSISDLREDIQKQSGIEVSEADIEAVLRVIQKFDPVGIGARNLQECLTLQLEEMTMDANDKDLCLRLINGFFDDFKLKHYEKLAKNLGITVDKVNELFEIIHHLDPFPGKLETNTIREYIYPDFIVHKSGNELIVELSDDSIPPLRISRNYIKLLKDRRTPKSTREFIKNKLESAKFFISSIMMRKETMMKVMNSIVSRQHEFFLSGGEGLKPMFEKDVAGDIEMDVSTVSRTVRNKYVQSDFGIFELKYFFSNSIQSDSGEDISTKIVKEKLKGFIENEDKTKPLSDDKLAELVNADGVPIARRTIAKYREAMKIPRATLRRQIKSN